MAVSASAIFFMSKLLERILAGTHSKPDSREGLCPERHGRNVPLRSACDKLSNRNHGYTAPREWRREPRNPRRRGPALAAPSLPLRPLRHRRHTHPLDAPEMAIGIL